MNILITGGSGLIGKHLGHYLETKGHKLASLSRQKDKSPNTYHWAPAKNIIDEQALIWADSVIHLAGAGIVEKKWTTARKKAIIDSRVKTAELILHTLQKHDIKIRSFISASGVNIYGTTTTRHIYQEQDSPAQDFVSQVCIEWEKAAHCFEKAQIPTTILRTGVVFTSGGGALEKMAKPIKFGIGSPLGTGKQYVPWIHIDDLCDLYLQALSNPKFQSETLNAVATEHITNSMLTRTLAKHLKKPLWAPKVPAFLLKLILGNRAKLVLEGSRISNQKILALGFEFNYPSLEKAIDSLNLK